MQAQHESTRFEWIQLLRFVAAALVLGAHTTFYFHERVQSSLPVWHYGEIGVPIFFMISGAVMAIASRAIPANASGAREFMAKRLIRIVPLYWLVTAIKVALAVLVPATVLHNHFDLVYAVRSFLFIPTFNSAGEIRPLHGVGWTLLHEMFFYLVFAGAMLVRLRPVPFASVIIGILYFVGLAIQPKDAFAIVATSPINLYFVEGMVLGSLLIASRTQSNGYARPLLILTGAIVVGLSLSALRIPLDPVVLIIGGCLPLLDRLPLTRAVKVLAKLGDSSYALYLFHPLLAPGTLLVVHKLVPSAPPAAKIALTMLATIAVSHVLYLVVETRLISLARRALLPKARTNVQEKPRSMLSPRP